jgi:hypothetical protein
VSLVLCTSSTNIQTTSLTWCVHRISNRDINPDRIFRASFIARHHAPRGIVYCVVFSLRGIIIVHYPSHGIIIARYQSSRGIIIVRHYPSHGIIIARYQSSRGIVIVRHYPSHGVIHPLLVVDSKVPIITLLITVPRTPLCKPLFA